MLHPEMAKKGKNVPMLIQALDPNPRRKMRSSGNREYRVEGKMHDPESNVDHLSSDSKIRTEGQLDAGDRGRMGGCGGMV